jgi:four helix bundle protein
MAGIKYLKAYQKAYTLAMEIFWASKQFPSIAKFAITGQIRRSSRSVAANLAVAYRKRQHPAYFLNKLSNCEAENSETHVWIDFARDCKYWSAEQAKSFRNQALEVGKLLLYMMTNPETLGLRKKDEQREIQENCIYVGYLQTAN